MGKGNRNQYSEADKAAALAALDLNEGNVYKTAQQLDMPRKTLEMWAKGRGINDDVADIRQGKKNELASLFEQIVRRYAERALSDEAITDTRGKDAVIAAATALDKLQLLTDQPTDRTDGTHRVIIEYTDDEA